MTSHMKFLSLIFALPLVSIGLSKNLNADKHSENRNPASISNRALKEIPKPFLQRMSPIKQATKSNSTFGILVEEEILSYDPETEKARIRIKADFESFIVSEAVQLEWKIAKDFELIEGRMSEEYHPMNVGEQQSVSIVIEGNPFTSHASFIEVYSLINSTKFGAVSPVNLRQSLKAHINRINGVEPEEEKKAFSEKASPSKQFKLIF